MSTYVTAMVDNQGSIVLAIGARAGDAGCADERRAALCGRLCGRRGVGVPDPDYV